MRFISFFILFFIFSSSAFCQSSAGEITYERHQFWINIMSKMPFMTKEDIEREQLTWGKRQGKWAEKYSLTFKGNQSIYTKMEDEDNYGYSWKEDDFLLMRDYQEKTTKDLVTFLGKNYLIEGNMPKYKWKILNEIKDVQGYLCMKAETTDPIKNTKIVAWFTDKIAISGGPEGLSGLPGLILAVEYNDDDVTIEATKINFSEETEIKLPKKMKGKSITREEYNGKVAKYIKEAIEGRKNPYWQMRY